MDTRRIAALALLAVGLGVAGCEEDQDRNQGGTAEQESGVPEGAIPAAPDTRPGSEAVQGGLSPTGTTADSVTNAAPAATAPASDSVR